MEIFKQVLKYIIIISLLLASSTLAWGSPAFIPPAVGNIDASTDSNEILTTSFDGQLYAWKADRILAEGSWPVKLWHTQQHYPTAIDSQNWQE